MIDRRVPFDDIAKAVDMPMCDLLTEVETIVSAGTKLNINYYVNQEVEPDVVAELMPSGLAYSIDPCVFSCCAILASFA